VFVLGEDMINMSKLSPVYRYRVELNDTHNTYTKVHTPIHQFERDRVDSEISAEPRISLADSRKEIVPFSSVIGTEGTH
jgi:hypothetical protein